MATVWVVERGEYSDYRVVGVFSSKVGAQLVADAINTLNTYASDRATIDEWPLDSAVSELQHGLRPYLVDMRKDGTVERCAVSDVSGYDLAGFVRMWRRTQAPAYRGNPDKPDVLHCNVWAKDEQHAVKIVNEHRAQIIASGRWDRDDEEVA